MSPSDRARAASKAAIFSQVLGVIGLTLDAAYWETSHGYVPVGHVVGIGVSAVLLAVLLARRGRGGVSSSAFAVLCNTAVVVVALWIADDILARGPRPWVPFQPHKLSVLTMALIAPTPMWVGVVCIAAFTIAAAVQYAGFPGNVQANLVSEEPWATIAYGTFALALLFHQKRVARMEREAARARAEIESLQRIARVGLAVRDLSNTPLQTLRLSTAIMRRLHPEEARRLDPMERAIQRLEELERALSKHGGSIDWDAEGASFDPVAVLQDGGKSGERGGAARERPPRQEERSIQR